MQTESTSSESRPRRPYSASDQPKPIETSLGSYSFPPAPRTSDGLSTFTTSDPLPPFAPLVENSPEPQFSFEPSFEPPLLSHFLPSRDVPLRTNESRDRDPRPASPEPTRFSTLGQAIYDGQDPREVLSSFSFARLITPYVPHEDHLPSPPPPSQRPTRCRRPEWEYDHQLPPPPAQFHRRSPSGLGPPIQIDNHSRAPPHAPARRELELETARPRQRASYSFPSPLPQQRRLESPVNLYDTNVDRSRQSSYEDEEEEPIPSLSLASQPRNIPRIQTSNSSSFSFHQSTRSSSHGAPSTTPSLSPEQSKRPFRGLGQSPNSRSVVGFFRPSPQSMLAPEAVIPEGIDFDSLPTKSSRGRKPPTAPALGIEASESVSTESGAGVTGAGTEKGGGEKGNGKGKKVWLCKVKGSFQCAFPSCGKLFSRHDNLNQHLRVHRSPHQTVEEFSAQVAACFNRRLVQVEQETQEIARKAQAEKEAAERKRKAAEAEESIYAPPRPIREEPPPPSESEAKESQPSKKRRRFSIDPNSSPPDNVNDQSESIGFVAPAPPPRKRAAPSTKSD